MFSIGCDTGFGYETAKHLHKIGFKVYAGCLNKAGEGSLDLEKEGIDVLQLDVTKEDEWDAAIDHIRHSNRDHATSSKKVRLERFI